MGDKHSHIDSKTRMALERIKMGELGLAAKARKGNAGAATGVLEFGQVSEEDAAKSQMLLKSLLDSPLPSGAKTRNIRFFKSAGKDSAESQKFLNELLEGAFRQDTVESRIEKPLAPNLDEPAPSKKADNGTQKETPKPDSDKPPKQAFISIEITRVGVPAKIEMQEEPSGEKILADYASLLHAKEKWRNLSWLSGYNASMGIFKKLMRRVMEVSGDDAILAREKEIRTKFVENAALAIAAEKLPLAAVLHAYNEVAYCLRKEDGERAKKEHYDRIDLERRASAIEMVPDAWQMARRIDADIVGYVVNNARDRIRQKENWLSVPEIEFGETMQSQNNAERTVVFTDAEDTRAKKPTPDPFQFAKTVDFEDMPVEKKGEKQPEKQGTPVELNGQRKDAVYMPLEATDGKKHSTLLEKAVAAFAPEALDSEKIGLKSQLKEYLTGKHAADYVVPASKVPKSEKTDSSEGTYLRFTGENWKEFVSWAILNGKSLPSSLKKPSDQTISWKKSEDGKRTTTS